MSREHEVKIKELNMDLIHPSTSQMNNPEQGGSKIVVIGKPGCFAKGTKILMYDGTIIPVEDVKENDVVMGYKSCPRKVLELCRGQEKMYDIILSDNTKITVNEKHVLSLKSCLTGNIENLTIKQYINKHPLFKEEYLWFRTNADFESKHQPVDEDMYTYGKNISSKIPLEYKTSSREDRLSLLAGIIDSCGYFDSKKESFILHNSNLSLTVLTENLNEVDLPVNDIAFLARSLGMEVKIDENKQIYIFGRSIRHIPTKILKIPFLFLYLYQDNLLYKFKIIPLLGTDEYFGFTVDGDSLFLLEDFSVVHNSGKTRIITSILYEKKHIFPVGLVMCGTEDSNQHYKKTFPNTFVFNKLNEEKIVDYIKRQKLAIKHINNPWSVLLLDDVTDDPKILYKPIFQNIFKNGRHHKSLYIFSLQCALDLKKSLRTCIDGTFILRETSKLIRKSLWENYAGIIPTLSIFNQLMDKLTMDYCCIYIDNTMGKSDDWKDYVYYYKASNIPSDFKFGCREFWDFHKVRYNEDYVDPIEV